MAFVVGVIMEDVTFAMNQQTHALAKFEIANARNARMICMMTVMIFATLDSFLSGITQNTTHWSKHLDVPKSAVTVEEYHIVVSNFATLTGT